MKFLKGDTTTNTLKPARVETGAEIRVPLFIEEGETVEVDNRAGSYLIPDMCFLLYL